MFFVFEMFHGFLLIGQKDLNAWILDRFSLVCELKTLESTLPKPLKEN